MANSNLRKIKEVNGWKVNHPHSAANIFYALFTLILAASPVAYLFLSTVVLTHPSDPSLSGQFNGLELIKTAIEFVKYLIGQPYTIENPLFGALYSQDFAGPVLFTAVPYFYLATAAILLIMGVFSVVFLILFLILLIRGYLKGNKAIKVFTTLDFVFSLLFALSYLVIYFGFTGSAASTSQGYKMEIWNNFYIAAGYLLVLIIVSIMYTVSFKDSIPENELEYHDDEPTVEHIAKVHEVTKTTYEQSSTLPPNLTSIGGHAFAENQALVVANIPSEVTKIGNSAFANCLKLKVVSLPETIEEIGYNCFFNCVELERINYAGTKEQWKKVRRGSNWLAKAKTTEVTCIDGVIIVTPYH